MGSQYSFCPHVIKMGSLCQCLKLSGWCRLGAESRTVDLKECMRAAPPVRCSKESNGADGHHGTGVVEGQFYRESLKEIVETNSVSNEFKGPERNFPSGFFYFLRKDVVKIKEAFESHAVAAKAYSKPGKLIALRHAMKNYLGRDSALADVIRAVVAGNLAPVGCTKRFRGITGYLFLSEELRKYRPVSDVKVPPEGFLNYREAACSLGIRTNVVRGLVLQRVLTAPAAYRNGYSKLIPAKQVQHFAARYVAATVIAKHFNLSGSSFAHYLRESGTPLLAVSIPDEGKGQALFLPRNTQVTKISRALRLSSPFVLRKTIFPKEWELNMR